MRRQLAELAWGAGDRKAALAELEDVLALDADDESTWTLLDEWSAPVANGARGAHGDDGMDLLARIESFAAERPWSARAALNLARAKVRRDDLDGGIAAAERALALDGRLVGAHDLRAVLLAMSGRLDEAEVACAPAVFGGPSRASSRDARRG